MKILGQKLNRRFFLSLFSLSALSAFLPDKVFGVPDTDYGVRDTLLGVPGRILARGGLLLERRR